MAAPRKLITGPPKRPTPSAAVTVLTQFNPRLESADDLDLRVRQHLAQHPAKAGNAAVAEKRHRALLLQLLPPAVLRGLQAALKPRDVTLVAVPTLLAALRTVRRQSLAEATQAARQHGGTAPKPPRAFMPNAKPRIQLQKLQQAEGCSVADYVRRLDQLVAQCGYDEDIGQAVAKDRLIIGLALAPMRRRLIDMLDRPGGASYAELRAFALRMEETGNAEEPIPLATHRQNQVGNPSGSMGNGNFNHSRDSMRNGNFNPMPNSVGNGNFNGMENQMGRPVENQVGRLMESGMGNPMANRVRNQTGDYVGENSRNPMGNHVRDNMRNPMSHFVSENLRNPMKDHVSGNMGNPMGNYGSENMRHPMGYNVRENMSNPDYVRENVRYPMGGEYVTGNMRNHMEEPMRNHMGDLMAQPMRNGEGWVGSMQHQTTPLREWEENGAPRGEGPMQADYAWRRQEVQCDDGFRRFDDRDWGGRDGERGAGHCGDGLDSCSRCGLTASPRSVSGILAAGKCPNCCLPWPRGPPAVRTWQGC